jgi:hypothetical protein
MQKRYGFVWHVITSEDAAGAICESAEVETSTAAEAEEKIEAWIKQCQIACDAKECACKEFGGDITTYISPKMFMSGMTQNMVQLN